MNNNIKDIIEYTISCFGFLCYRRGPVSGFDFSNLIRNHCNNLKATLCADMAEKYITTVTYNGQGIKAIINYKEINNQSKDRRKTNEL